MFHLERKQENKVLAGLAGLMLLTRFHHFGGLNTLPDASLAVFFLAGLYAARRLWVLPALLLQAGLIDYVAIQYGGVSDWCVSAAYGFLIPTYAVMWQGGRWCARFLATYPAAVSKGLLVLLSAGTLAFLISNGSFYALSGRFAEWSLTEYFARVAKYYPSYMLTTLVYTTVVLLMHAVLHHVLVAQTSRR